MKQFFKDFKAFAMKGNIMDMAVGVVIGGAFGKIVSSLVADIITPLISLLTGGVNLAEKFVVLSTPEGVSEVPATATAAVEAGFGVLRYGAFCQSILDFLIIALSIFAVLRVMMKAQKKLESLKKKEEEAPAAPTTKTCPFCKSEIALEATRCPHCTSELKD